MKLQSLTECLQKGDLLGFHDELLNLPPLYAKVIFRYMKDHNYPLFKAVLRMSELSVNGAKQAFIHCRDVELPMKNDVTRYDSIINSTIVDRINSWCKLNLFFKLQSNENSYVLPHNEEAILMASENHPEYIFLPL